MTYVDLNPIRAGIADTPESSDYTAVQRRIAEPQNHGLMPFSDETRDRPAIPFYLMSYLELVEWSGRVIHPNKKGAIPVTTPLILQRLHIDANQLAAYLRRKPDKLPNALGSAAALLKLAQTFGLKCFRGMTDRKALLAAD